ncbi:uncharacterized, partial [Tachysurus ichikawai]
WVPPFASADKPGAARLSRRRDSTKPESCFSDHLSSTAPQSTPLGARLASPLIYTLQGFVNSSEIRRAQEQKCSKTPGALWRGASCMSRRGSSSWLPGFPVASWFCSTCVLPVGSSSRRVFGLENLLKLEAQNMALIR